jgi:hypothetical protein
MLSEQIAIRLTPADYAVLAARAEAERRSIANLARMLLQDAIAQVKIPA